MFDQDCLKNIRGEVLSLFNRRPLYEYTER